MSAIVRIAETRSTERAGMPALRPVQLRNLSGRSGQVPSLHQLLREGRASSVRIGEQEKGIRRFRKTVLMEWLDQAERLWIAAEKHGLKGKRFLVFAAQIGIDRSTAFELLKLHPHRKQTLDICRREDHWPGWEVCAGWFKAAVAGSDIEPDSLTTRNKNLPMPSGARLKASNDEYGTPQALFDHYDRIHHFTLDVCSTPLLAKCQKFYTVAQNGLKQEWVGVCWMNPPYSALSDW
jgi:DNA N-6-adenine-methyltransferase (Dam)